jgi:hypothetical protein
VLLLVQSSGLVVSGSATNGSTIDNDNERGHCYLKEPNSHKNIESHTFLWFFFLLCRFASSWTRDVVIIIVIVFVVVVVVGVVVVAVSPPPPPQAQRAAAGGVEDFTNAIYIDGLG